MALQLTTSRSLISKKLVGAFIAVFALFIQPLVALDVPSAFAAPVVNEVMPNPVTITDTQGEWVEIHNQGTEEADISGWTLNDGGSESYTFASNTVLAGDEYYVVCRTMTTAEANCDAEWSGMSLLNTGDTVTLRNAATQLQDAFEYDGSNDGESVEAVREDNTTTSVNNSTSSYGTKDNTGTPGAANNAQPTGGVVNETTGEHFTTIQGAIDDTNTTDGDTIIVRNGDYEASNINVNKELTITGQGSPVLIVPDVTQTNAFDVWADNVTIQGLTIVGPADGTSYETYAWGGTVTRGVVVHNGAENVLVTNNKIRGLRNNVLVDGRNTGSITDNEIDNSKSGVSVQYTDAGTGNTENYSMTISGNYEGDYGNEWGLNTHLNGHYVGGTYHPNVPNSNSEKIAVNAPVSVQTALKQNSANNDNWTVQDQGYRYHNRTAVYVDGDAGSDASQGSPLGSLATIQAGVNAIVADGAINIAEGTYTENVTLSNPVDLTGTGVTLVGQISVYSSNVSVEGLTITNPAYSGATIRGVHVYGDNSGISNITIENNTFTNIRNNNTKGAYAVMVQGNVSGVSVSGNTISGISSAGWAHGIEVTPAGGVSAVPQNVSVTGNLILGVTNDAHNDQYDFSVDASGSIAANATEITFNKNRLSGNVRNLDLTSNLDASQNWWWGSDTANNGVTTGPSSDRYTGSGSVTVAPWCYHSDCTILASNEESTTLPLTAPGVAQTDTGFIFTESPATGNVYVVLEKGTVVTGNSSLWDGTIKAPTVVPFTVLGAKSTEMAISIGSDEYGLTFDKPVLLVFYGQAGKSVGFKTPGGVFTEITNICKGIGVNYATIALEPSVNECKVSVGDNLFVVTSHFTLFAVYNAGMTAPISPVAEGDLETEQGSISPLRGQGALTSSAIAASSADDKDSGVLGTATEDTDTSADKSVPLAPSEEGWKLWGIAWYWWLLALGALGFGSWYAVRRYRGPSDDF